MLGLTDLPAPFPTHECSVANMGAHDGGKITNPPPQCMLTCSETEIPAVEEKERVGSLPHKNPKQDRLIEASALRLKYQIRC
jgi:hypothetical protein